MDSTEKGNQPREQPVLSSSSHPYRGFFKRYNHSTRGNKSKKYPPLNELPASCYSDSNNQTHGGLSFYLRIKSDLAMQGT